ncbi:MAG: regulatory protein [Halothiobacillaceae bacterium]|nr:MAG: regulatory protein [Halothiobacillaceae bacterium]
MPSGNGASDNSAELFKEARAVAIGYLARREYSANELRERLHHKGFPHELITALLADLQERDLQSDQRFSDAYVRARKEKGYGPTRIGGELQQKGISAATAHASLHDPDHDWRAQARLLKIRRFGQGRSAAPNELLKQKRFLYQKGYSNEHIRAAFDDDEQDVLMS